MSVTVTGTPTPVGSTLPLYIKQPFSYTFSGGKLYSTSYTYTSTSSAVLGFTSGNTFSSGLGFLSTGTASLGVTAVSSNPIGTVSTYAGVVGGGGSNNGAKATARFYYPNDVAIDTSGNQYIIDTELSLVRKIDTTGIVSTIAGAGSLGSNDGSALSAKFRYPRGLTVDSSGVVYIADTQNNRIRKLASGTVSTLDTSLTEPFGVVADSNNNIYYPDIASGIIYYYNTSTNTRTIYAGSSNGYANGYRTSAQFSVILGLAIDKYGNIYVADNGNSRLRKITISTGMVTTLAGNGNISSVDGSPTTGSFNQIQKLVLDENGIIYVAERSGNKIRRVTQSGNITTLAGTGVAGSTNGYGTSAQFRNPQGIGYSNNILYVADTNNNVIRAITTEEVNVSSSRPDGYTIVAQGSYNITVDDRITVSPAIVGTALQLYKYEPFSYTFTGTVPGDTLQYSASSTQLYSYFSNVTPSELVFSSTTGFLGTYSNLSIIVQALSGSSEVDARSYTLNVGVGRFFPPASNTAYTFYRNEPITPQPFVAPFAISTPISSPTLPIGLQLVRTSDSSFDLSGAPTVQILSSNYKIIGKKATDPSQIITVDINIRVSPERLVLDLSGSSNAFGLSGGATIPSATVTASCPPYPLAGSNIYYSWTPALLDGLSFKDVCGNFYGNGSVAVDASSTITLSGTVSSNAARALANSGLTNYTTTLTSTRLSPSTLSNSIPFFFSFQESVLFDAYTITPLYVGATVVSSSNSNSFRAVTRFSTSNYPISNIFSPNLRSDLSLNFVYGDSRAYLTGIPTSNDTGIYTIRAQNTNGTIGDIQVSIASSNDVVYFTLPTVDTSYTFVQSRDVNAALAVYYTSPIQFNAYAASGCNVTMSTGDLAGTGLSLTSAGANIYQITGVPSIPVTLPTILNVTAISVGTPATSTNSLVSYTIIADDYTFASPALDFIQNVPIVPIQFSATTISGRPIVSYSSTNLPAGLIVSPSGLLTGSITTGINGSFTLNASTGYTSDSQLYFYTVVPDSVLLTVPSNVYYLKDGAPVPTITITGTSYSGRVVSNYQFSNMPKTYGFTIGSTTGNLSGNLSTGYPPDDAYTSSYSFNIVAAAGSVAGNLPVTMTATVPPPTRNVVANITDNKIYSAENGLSNWTLRDTASNSILAFSARTELDSNTFIGSYSSNNLFRSTDGLSYADGSANAVFTSFTSKPGTKTWWASGRDLVTSNAVLGRSDDDGVTWTITPTPEFLFRDDGSPGPYAYYTYAGGVLKYGSNVMLFGGKTAVRSLDGGSNWTQVNGELDAEISDINVTNPNMLVMTGSSIYSSNTPYLYGDSTTIRYSDNNGLTWFDSAGDFNYKATNVTYGNGTWVATGIQAPYADLDYRPELRYSTDGINWNLFDISTGALFGTREPGVLTQPNRLGPVMYDGINWNILVSRYVDIIAKFGNIVELYTHDVVSPLDSGWTVTTVSGIAGNSNALPRFIGLSTPMTTSTSTFSPTLYFTSLGNGPTITNPTTTNYIFYQYMSIDPIILTATGTGDIYFFIDRATLPVGITFNPQTREISGKPMRTGNQSTIVYAKDNNGVTALVLTFTTIIPRIIHPQSGAGAFTSLVRQYTEVNAAQNSRDNRVFPAQERALGEFMAPQGVDVVTPSNCPC
jgi:serine/threonine-protein kinase